MLTLYSLFGDRLCNYFFFLVFVFELSVFRNWVASLVGFEVFFDRSLRDAPDHTTYHPRGKHEHQRSPHDCAGAVACGQAHEDRGRETYKCETGCYDTGGDR